MFLMLVLIQILQFYAFIALWRVAYPKHTKIVFKELRRITLGEFLDDLQFGKNLSEFFGLSSEEDSANDGLEEKVGEERLGSKYITKNLGITFFLLTGLILLILLTVLCFFYLTKLW